MHKTSLVPHAMDRRTRTSRLINAIKQGRLADVVRMLREGTSAHDLGDFGDAFVRPIAVATGYGHIDIIKALIARGADAEATCYSNMDGAWKGNPASLHGCKALHIAAAVGNAEAILVLLQLGAHPNSTNTNGVTPMMVACESSSGTSTKLEMLHSLLRAGAAPALENELGALAIHYAAARCETEVVELLLSKAPSTLNHADNHGCSPLGAAALQGRESTLSLLLSAGASDRIVWATKGVSALHEAIGIGKGNSVRFLLENGLEAVGGLPAIAGAMAVSVSYGYIDILEMLLNVEGEEKQEVWANQHAYFAHDGSLLRGVPGPTMATKFEWLPILHYAAKYCSIPALRILLSAGADTETCDLKGKLAVEHIGSLLPDDKRNGSMEAAVQRMLRKGPAFRVRSWAWPGSMAATHGGASKVPQSSSNPVPKKTRTGARTFGKMGQRLDISRSFDW